MAKILLPQFVGENTKIQRVIVFGIMNFVLYSVASVFHLGSPTYFELTPLEQNIPLIPESIWPYVFLYPFLVGTFLHYRNIKILNLVGYAFIFLQIFTCIIFMLFPVAYPREFFPLPLENSLTIRLFMGLRKLDSPMNCMPSLHVSNCFLVSYGMLLENKKKFIPWILLTVMISLSTLTTKQHYLFDVISATLLSTVIFLVAYNFFDIEETA